jgi:hypothetical protein
VLLPALAVGEVEVLDGDGHRAAATGEVQQSGQCVPELRVPVVYAAGQVVEEALRLTHRVAVHVEAPGRQVVVIHVYPDDTPGESPLQGQQAGDGALPGRGHVPAATRHVVVETVGYRPVS